jgi:hypothetical protein
VFSARNPRGPAYCLSGRTLRPIRGAQTHPRVVAGILGILTSFWHDWIEALTGWDPDQRSGGGEWLIVALLLTVSVLVGLAGRRNWKLAAANSWTF